MEIKQQIKQTNKQTNKQNKLPLVIFLFTEIVQKDPKNLAMNQADNYRQIQEDRYTVDRTIPAVDYGKGCELNILSIMVILFIGHIWLNIFISI